MFNKAFVNLQAAAGRPVTQPNRPRLLVVTPTEGAAAL